MKNKRRFIGIDKSEEACEIAARRLNEDVFAGKVEMTQVNLM